MTTPQDPFGGTPFGQTPDGPPIFTAGPPPRASVNNLATLSVIFAFVFAPAGAVLGHLGLSEVRRTGQPGRGRALTGLVASYVVIAVTVIAVAIGTITQSSSRTTTHSSAAGPGARTVPTSTVSPSSHVAPGELAGLMPSGEQMKALTSDFGLTLHQTVTALAELPRVGVVDRSECQGLIIVGDARVYDAAAVRGLYLTDYSDIAAGTILEPTQAVTAYDDARSAQAALNALLNGWHRCAGTTFNLTFGGKVLPQRADAAVDAGEGITTVTITTTNAPLVTSRAIVAKSNVIVDVMVGAKRDPAPLTLAITKFILGKIPA